MTLEQIRQYLEGVDVKLMLDEKTPDMKTVVTVTLSALKDLESLWEDQRSNARAAEDKAFQEGYDEGFSDGRTEGYEQGLENAYAREDDTEY